jgi:hypothetical protein
VQPECLRYALASREYGIWGGTDQIMRDLVLKMARKSIGTHNTTWWDKKLWDKTVEVAEDLVYRPTRELNVRGKVELRKKVANPLRRVKESNPT